MMNLNNHPFAVEAFFKHSIVVTFAVPRVHLQSYIPPCLELDTYKDEWAFLAVALVQTKLLRPKGFPEFMGNDFFLIGYRVFVRYTNTEGRRLRGLYILKSETDKKKMAFFGNIFTHYHYSTTDIRQEISGNQISIASERSGLRLLVEQNETVALPSGSPFSDWKEARRFAGPLPFTFTFDEKTNKVLIIEGVRENWTPQPVHVKDCKISYLDRLSLPGIQLANAFIIHDIPYYWKKGKVEQWKENPSKAL